MRTNAAPTHNFYVSFREWVNSNYHSLDDEVWSEIMDEDYQIDYDNLGNRSYDNVEEEVINDDIQDGNCSSDLIS